MKKILYASGFITLGLLLLYVVLSSGHTHIPAYIHYALAFFAAIFIGLLVYYLLQRLKK